MQGLLSSLYTLGCFFGCVGSISFSEKIGRKKPILIGTVLISIGAVIQTAAYSPAQFIVGRIVSGMGTGLNTSVIPVWQAETLPAKKRERFGAIQYVLVCTGTTISYWMAYALSYSANSVFQWRFLVAAQLVFAVLIMCLGKSLMYFSLIMLGTQLTVCSSIDAGVPQMALRPRLPRQSPVYPDENAWNIG